MVTIHYGEPAPSTTQMTAFEALISCLTYQVDVARQKANEVADLTYKLVPSQQANCAKSSGDERPTDGGIIDQLNRLVALLEQANYLNEDTLSVLRTLI